MWLNIRDSWWWQLAASLWYLRVNKLIMYGTCIRYAPRSTGTSALRCSGKLSNINRRWEDKVKALSLKEYMTRLSPITRLCSERKHPNIFGNLLMKGLALKCSTAQWLICRDWQTTDFARWDSLMLNFITWTHWKEKGFRNTFRPELQRVLSVDIAPLEGPHSLHREGYSEEIRNRV